jgi:hypothetical protein
MTEAEIIIELANDLYTVKKAYKSEQKESDKYREWWLDETVKLETVKEDLKNANDKLYEATLDPKDVQKIC